MTPHIQTIITTCLTYIQEIINLLFGVVVDVNQTDRHFIYAYYKENHKILKCFLLSWHFSPEISLISTAKLEIFTLLSHFLIFFLKLCNNILVKYGRLNINISSLPAPTPNSMQIKVRQTIRRSHDNMDELQKSLR